MQAMQVTETSSEGLKREFKVVVPAADLEARLNTRLDEIKGRVRLAGFRPGKVPVTHLKKVYGRAVMAETIEQVVRETNAKIIADGGFKLALDPKVVLPENQSEIEGVIAGKSDLSYTVALEVVPPIELADFKQIKLEKMTTEVGDDMIKEAIDKIAEQNRPYSAKAEGGKAENGDRVTVSFVGKIDDEPFEGGTGEDIPVAIGSGSFIPGFEDQLIGIAAGEQRDVTATFPTNYMSDKLAGKTAVFAVTVKSIEAPAAMLAGDDLAKAVGLDSMQKLHDAVKDRLQREHAAVSRQHIKRALLDQLDQLHTFTPPPTLVDEEFNGVWATVVNDLKTASRTFADEGTTEEKAREDYLKIANRRVRLGLVLAEIGEKNNIKVSDEELTRAIVERARQFPGREQEIWEHFRNNPSSLASLRAPIFEEKVVDFILELATVTEKPVSREVLYKEDEDTTPA